MRIPLAAAMLTAVFVASPAAAQLPDAATTHSEVISEPWQPNPDAKAPTSDYRPSAPSTPRPKPFQKFDWDHPEPGKNGYFADDYHTVWVGSDGTALGRGARVYRGRDLRYYCRRWDGSTQLIDARTTALLGDSLAPGGSAQLRTIALSALANREVRCGGEIPGATEIDPRGRDSRIEGAPLRNLGN